MDNNKLHGFRKRGTELSYKRYAGMIIEYKEDLIPYDERKYEVSNYMKNFVMAGQPIQKEILIAEELLKELEEEAIKKDVDLSSLITTYLLEQLERNKPTRICAKGKTKGKLAYVLNSLYGTSNFIQYVESKEEFEKNIFSNRELEESLTYEHTMIDECRYIEDYLINKGYSNEQIEDIKKEELEKFGTYEVDGVSILRMYPVEMEHYLEIQGKEVASFDFKVLVYVPARLGFHYVLMNKKNSPKTYEGIEELINKGGYKVWDLYAKFLEMESQKKTNHQKAE